MKRIISLFIVFIMVLASTNIGLAAYETDETEAIEIQNIKAAEEIEDTINVELVSSANSTASTSINYEVKGGYIYFDTGTGTVTDADESITMAVIPSEINGVKVTSIGDYAFEYCSSLTSITIPSSVTSIGRSAFEDCSSLTSITIPSSVTSIGDRAFRNCDSLTGITIPSSVTSIGDSAFCYCSCLKSITIPSSVTSIGDSAFSSCVSLTGITIPSAVTSIGDSAFSSCVSLTGITIPNSVTSIGDHAFYECKSLKSITIPSSVTSIDGYAFRGCDSLTGITIPSSVTSIGVGAFDICESLISINVDDNNNNYKSVDGVLFSKSAAEIIKYPEGKKATSYVIPSAVTSIGAKAFGYCSSLTSITIPSEVTSIGDEAFRYCSSLTSITIPSAVTSIGDSAFYYCSSLKSITIPSSVTSIGDGAFGSCSSLTSITIPSSVTSIGDSAFAGCSRLTSITISSAVTSIGYDAFCYCSSLTSITIPSAVTSIGYGAFWSCSSLTSITIPNSVTSIGDSAFKGCSRLTSIYLYKDSYAETYAKENELKYVYLDRDTSINSTPYENPNIQQAADKYNNYYFVIKDKKGNYANATITYGTEAVTVSNGQLAAFKKNGNVKKVTVTSSDGTAVEYDVDSIISRTGVYVLYAYNQGESKLALSSVTYSYGDKNFDVLHSPHNIEIDHNDFKLICNPINKDSIAAYNVYSGNKLVKRSTSNEITLSAEDFVAGAKVYIITESAVSTEGNLRNNLQFRVYSGTNTFDEVELFGSGPSVTLSEDAEPFGGENIKLNLPKVPITVTKSNGKIKVALNLIESAIDEKGVTGKTFKKSFEEFVKDPSKNDKFFKDYSKKYLDGELPFSTEKTEVQIIGYGEAEYSDSLEEINVAIVLKVKAKGEYNNQYMVLFVPVGVGISVEGELLTEFKGGYNFINQKLEGEVGLDLSLEVDADVGLGIRKWVYAGIYGEAAVGVDCTIISSTKPTGIDRAWLSGELGVTGHFMTKEGKVPVLSTKDLSNYFDLDEEKVIVYQRNNKSKMALKYDLASLGNILYSANNFVSDTTAYSTSLTTDTDGGIIAENVYPDAKPQLANTNDGEILVFVDIDETRAAANRTRLAFSRFDTGTNKWSDAVAVDDNNTPDANPVVYNDTANTYVIYQQTNKELDDSAEMNEYLENIVLSVAKYDTAEDKFTEIGDISTGKYAYNYKLFTTENGLEAVWVENSDNNYFGTTANNTIYHSVYRDGQWSVPKVLLQNINSVTSLAYNGEYIYYTVDDDNNLATVEDGILYCYNVNSSKNTVVDKGNVTGALYTASPLDEMTYLFTWIKDNNVYYSNDTEIKELGVSAQDDYIFFENRIYYTISKDGARELYCSVYQNDIWGSPVAVSDTGQYVDYFSTDGEKSAMVVTSASVNGEEINTSSSLVIFDYERSYDIALEYVNFDGDYVVPGEQLPLTVAIKNNSDTMLTSANITVTSANGNVVANETPKMAVKSGDTQEVIVFMTVPENIDGSQYTVTVNTVDSVDKNTVDNSSVFTINKSDLVATAVFTKDEEVSSAIFSVENISYMPSGGVFTVKDKNQNVLLNESFESINNGEIKTFTLDINDSSFDSFEDNTLLYYSVTADNEEYYDYNNSGELLITRDMNYNLGDVNKSGVVDKTDATLLLKYLSDIKINEVLNMDVADINDDGITDIKDVIDILKAIA